MTNAMSTKSALADAVAYFAGLPRFTLSAVQAAWDKTQSDRFTHRGIWNSLCKDFNHVAFEPPKFDVFAEWAAGAAAGHVQRPQSPVSLPDQKTKLFAAVPDFSSDLQDVPPLAPTSEVVGADVSIEMFATRLFDDTVASLNRDVQSKAAEIVAKRFREIAERYDALAA